MLFRKGLLLANWLPQCLSKRPEQSQQLFALRYSLISESTIESFNNLKKNNKKESPKPQHGGIINIDLLANPILKDKYSSVPSVSKILNETMPGPSKVALDKWKCRMIEAMGEEKFKEFYQEQLERGKDFHESLKFYLLGKSDLAEKQKSNLCLKSTEWVLKDISDVIAVESFVVHSGLGYKGIFDCIALYKNKPVLIEWKHTSKRKSKVSSTYDAPLQMSAYIGAVSQDTNYNFQVDKGLIVVAHSDGSPAELFELNTDEVQKYWSIWLQRLKQYIGLQKKSLPA